MIACARVAGSPSCLFRSRRWTWSTPSFSSSHWASAWVVSQRQYCTSPYSTDALPAYKGAVANYSFLLTVLMLVQMTRVIALLVAGLALGSCSSVGEKVSDWMPQWMGGLPRDVPPRPGTPEYDEFQRKREAERSRDKSQDPPKPSTATGTKSSQ